MQGIVMEVKPNPLAMEVISYLAYETVAQVSMKQTLLTGRSLAYNLLLFIG